MQGSGIAAPIQEENGLLAAFQAIGNLAASAIAGVLWTAISPTAAFLYVAAWMVLALFGLLLIVLPERGG